MICPITGSFDMSERQHNRAASSSVRGIRAALDQVGRSPLLPTVFYDLAQLLQQRWVVNTNSLPHPRTFPELSPAIGVRVASV